MSWLSIISLVLSAAGPLLAAWAHYRLNQVPVAPATPPRLGDGHILAVLLQLLGGSAAAPAASAAPDPLALLVPLLEKAISGGTPPVAPVAPDPVAALVAALTQALAGLSAAAVTTAPTVGQPARV